MDISGTYELQAPPQTVWQALNEPTVLARCIPGCKDVSRLGHERFSFEVMAVFGPVKARFTGELQIEQSEPPHHYVLAGSGKGAAAGFGKGRAEVWLKEITDGTELRYTASVSIGGKLAQVGTRLLGAATKKLSDEFFTNFATALAIPATLS